MAHNLVQRLDGSEILEVVRVINLARGPRAFVCGVGDLRSNPLALVVRVGLVGTLPLAATSSIGTFRVGDGGGNPVTVFLIVPFLGLGRIYIIQSC